jgi:hypothetical protein
MKKAVSFELFEPNQTMYFDIMRLKEFEDRMGMPFGRMVGQECSIKFCLIGLSVGLKHHYPQIKPDAFWAEKMDEYMEKGGTLEDIFLKIAEAIGMSNALGKFTPQPNEIKNAEKVQMAGIPEKSTASQNG